ncbi:TetR family transcriptional regulator C-terminal domain-containing protein [Croceibacterium sp. LX-88]|uniref:TetR family transcriptional regulator C-terminal domain-containing protein n=1 Tax=Croceibacterium selenioxidans TaxID=2838833 RepID=A0ABS5W5K0_9SPHN|nr:TetR family transcriptional regulator C-terminal domain-containing protein [Croceibacterium selenioxidans]MBT2135038.1 TetR family transcriptional regulator C-terminal domain-containing protein [Croceibacterium selenioxidans]
MASRQSAFTRSAPDERRHSLIEATARCLAERGAAGVSVRTICAEAGVSPGLLRHYFAGVSDAIAEAYRWTGTKVALALSEAVAAAGPHPRARLLAYLTASFRPPIAHPELLATWIAFWSLTRSDPAIAVVHQDIYRDFRSGIEALVDEWRPGTDPRLPAVALTALIDGLWLELSLGHAPFTPEEAERLVGLWLDGLLG